MDDNRFPPTPGIKAAMARLEAGTGATAIDRLALTAAADRLADAAQLLLDETLGDPVLEQALQSYRAMRSAAK